MRIACKDTTPETERRASWQPKDPIWAPTAALARVRAALKAYDEMLNLWWSPIQRMGSELPGRWRVVRYMQTVGEFDTVLYWEGEGASYRDVPGDPSSIIAEVARRDLSRTMAVPSSKRHAADVDAYNATLKQHRREAADEQARKDSEMEVRELNTISVAVKPGAP